MLYMCTDYPDSSLPLVLCTGTPFPNGDRSMYGIHQILGIRLKLHISNDIFAVNKALPKTHPFEKVKFAAVAITS